MHNYLEILVTLGFLGAMIWGMMSFLRRDMHKDMMEIKNAQARTDARLDHLYEETNRLYRTLNEETNRLYRTLIDIVQKK